MGSLNALDLAFLIAIAFGIYRGLTQGLIGSVLTVFRFSISLILALRFNNIMSRVLSNSGRIDSAFTPIISFVVLFCGFMVAMFILNLVLNFFVKAAHLSSVSKMTGIALWGFMLTLGFSFLTSLADKGGLLTADLKRNSKIYPIVEPLADVMMCKMYFVMPATAQILQSLENTTKNAANYIVGDCRSGQNSTEPYNEAPAQEEESNDDVYN
jgi:membrane protein required for colicin V production